MPNTAPPVRTSLRTLSIQKNLTLDHTCQSPDQVTIKVTNAEGEPARNAKLKRSYRHWIRRILIGKNEQEELEEARDRKTLNFLKKVVRRHVAEFIGSFLVVFFIAGIQVNQDFFINGGGVANIDKGFVAGSLLTGLIYCFGQISGAHFNPCVTLAFMLRGSFSLPKFFSYITVQFAGAVSGAAALYGLFGNINGLGTTTPGPGVGESHAFWIEAIITFLLITVALSTAVSAHIIGAASGLAVGTTFGALQIWAWNFSGASANPWRTIGPTMISGVGWDTYWIYIAGPIVGTLFAVLLQRLMVTGACRNTVKEVGMGNGRLLTMSSKIFDAN